MKHGKVHLKPILSYKLYGVIAEPLQVLKMANKDSSHRIFFFFYNNLAVCCSLIFRELSLLAYSHKRMDICTNKLRWYYTGVP